MKEGENGDTENERIKENLYNQEKEEEDFFFFSSRRRHTR